MTWVRLDEGFARHPKILTAGPLGMAMQVAALCYCNEYLTDGFIPKAVPANLLGLEGLAMYCWSNGVIGGGDDAEWEFIVAELVTAGLWEEVENGWQIHDYHEYQPSKEEVLELREKRADAGRKGGLAKAKASAKQTASKTPSKTPSKPLAKSYPGTGTVPERESSNGTGTTGAENDFSDERTYAVSMLLAALSDKTTRTPSVVAALAARLPVGSIHKVRESVIVKAQEGTLDSASGYAVAALKSEIQERSAA